MSPVPSFRALHRFVIPGEPVSWKRAKRGKGYSYTDPKDKAHREKIRAYARNAGIRRPFVGEVRIDVRVFTSLPPLDRRVGDRDNYLKAVQDALQGIAVRDDRQFCAGETVKAQDAANPRTEVTIAEGSTEAEAARDDLDTPASYREAK